MEYLIEHTENFHGHQNEYKIPLMFTQQAVFRHLGNMHIRNKVTS